MSISDEELKRRMLELLRRDREFRRLVAAELGMLEILERLEAHDRKFEELLEELRRMRRDFNERLEGLEKRVEKLEERMERLENRIDSLEKRVERLEHRVDRLEKRVEGLEGRVNRLERTTEELKKSNARIMDMLGALAESVYSKFTLDAVIYEAAAAGDRIVRWERNARIDDRDIDLLIVTQRRVYVVEVKLAPRHQDVDQLLEKARLVEKHHPGREIIPVLTGTRIGREVAQYALSKGVRVYAW